MSTINKKIIRLRRYFKYLFQWIFCEKIRGLDFTMRDLSLIDKTGGVLHGYSKTDEAHANAIFNALGVDNNKKLLDVGCGKGAFLRIASKKNFGKLAGLEYVENLAEIARKNFRKLHLDDRIEIIQGDAKEFDRYCDYNVFYFFNPFDKDIMEVVIDKIIQTKGTSKIWIILHNPVCADVVVARGGRAIKELYDKVKAYRTIIYELP